MFRLAVRIVRTIPPHQEVVNHYNLRFRPLITRSQHQFSVCEQLKDKDKLPKFKDHVLEKNYQELERALDSLTCWKVSLLKEKGKDNAQGLIEYLEALLKMKWALPPFQVSSPKTRKELWEFFILKDSRLQSTLIKEDIIPSKEQCLARIEQDEFTSSCYLEGLCKGQVAETICLMHQALDEDIKKGKKTGRLKAHGQVIEFIREPLSHEQAKMLVTVGSALGFKLQPVEMFEDKFLSFSRKALVRKIRRAIL